MPTLGLDNTGNWLFAIMSGIIVYIMNLLKGKVSKEQFKEFKEANAIQHKTMVDTQHDHGEKLDTIIANMPRKK